MVQFMQKNEKEKIVKLNERKNNYNNYFVFLFIDQVLSQEFSANWYQNVPYTRISNRFTRHQYIYSSYERNRVTRQNDCGSWMC